MKVTAARAIVLAAFVLLPLAVNGQRRRETPVVYWVDWDCLTSEYPRLKLNRVVGKAVDEFGNGYVAKWGDRALAYDLNGDRRAEYFVPLGCSAVGNCSWGIFSARPARLLGVVDAEDIYVRKRSGKWAALTAYIHDNASDGYLTNYAFRNGAYRKSGSSRNVSAYFGVPGFSTRGIHRYPRFMRTNSSPGSSRKGFR